MLHQVNPGKTLFRVGSTGYWFSPGAWEDARLWETNQVLKFGPYDFKTINSPICGSNRYHTDHFSVGLPCFLSSALTGMSSQFERARTSSQLQRGCLGLRREGLGNGITPGGTHSVGVSKDYHLLFKEVKGAPKKCIFKQRFAFICINLKIKSYENKNGRQTIWNSVWKKIHEMQICERINDRSIFSCLISMRSWLIVLLLNNYPEFTQGLESQALGCGSFFCFASSSRPLETG